MSQHGPIRQPQLLHADNPCATPGRQRAISKLNAQAEGLIASDVVTGDDVIWKVDPKKCPNGNHPAITANCVHPTRWMYTTNDGHLGKSCQLGKDNPTGAERAYAKYMLK
jgi:hypothetical protein